MADATTSGRRRLIAVAVLLFLAGCGSPMGSPSAVPPSAVPASPSVAVACGPLGGDLCAKAVTVAEDTFPATMVRCSRARSRAEKTSTPLSP